MARLPEPAEISSTWVGDTVMAEAAEAATTARATSIASILSSLAPWSRKAELTVGLLRCQCYAQGVGIAALHERKAVGERGDGHAERTREGGCNRLRGPALRASRAGCCRSVDRGGDTVPCRR